MAFHKVPGEPLPNRSQGSQAWRDELVMATNNSSIVSKRSVERLYYSGEPHFFRFFVNKFQRRAPLINRGYHLRMQVVDTIVRSFLEQPSSKPRAVVNLGCGSDVLPWQCFTRYPEQSRGAKFIDVDFPELMLRKRHVVMATPELCSSLSNLVLSPDFPLLLRSEEYVQIGCDLRDISTLEKALSSIVDVSETRVLFVAEVSITYMETVGADALISWASHVGQAEFCLLEQILPDGPSHPFAMTMLDHFQKLNSPLKSVLTYPTLEDQKARFLARGWVSAEAWSLWDAWSDDLFFLPLDRRGLEDVEPFDEWEEFALFASHYLILWAKGVGATATPPGTPPILEPQVPRVPVDVRHRAYEGQRGIRRFAAPMAITDAFGSDIVVNSMGLGTKGRLRSCDIYTVADCSSEFSLDPGGPSSRMCHTITDIGHYGILLVGGRSSPSSPFKDCWLFTVDTRRWRRVQELPVPLYRHSTTRLASSSMLLVAGGKLDARAIFEGYLLYHPELGWVACHVEGNVRPRPFFGGVLLCSGRVSQTPARFSGLLAGGLLDDGVLNNGIFSWLLTVENIRKPTIQFSLCTGLLGTARPVHPGIVRFGAACVPHNNLLLVLGGISHQGVVQHSSEVLACSVSPDSCEIAVSSVCISRNSPRPLLVGSSVVSTTSGNVLIMGGGATCFSMGTFWTRGIYSFVLDSTVLDDLQLGSSPLPQSHCWELSQTLEIVSEDTTTSTYADSTALKSPEGPRPIPRVTVGSEERFAKYLQESRPVVMQALYLGGCVEKWSLEYLLKAIGGDRKVIVHESNSEKMDFTAKNFRYVTKTFGQFAEEVKNGGRLYLRALSREKPADRPTVLEEDFPSIAPDFVLPQELAVVSTRLFSSVLRISGAVNMWLHYDVMANVYCQITGSRRFVLFPPSDVTHLPFPPGASSSGFDVFGSMDSPRLHQTRPYEATLSPGDILFIPSLWLHTAAPESLTSIAVNIFFRDSETGYAAGRDVYGNRDLAGYENGRQEIARIAKAFNNAHAEARDFYLRRLAAELLSKTCD